MKITGIIAEYNPFHNGHAYQLDYIRSQLDTDYTIVVMNGDFMQRGEAAMWNKYDRTAMALDAGADLVLELPALYGTGSAEFFATGAIRLLNELGCVDQLCFGCEIEQLELLRRIASIYLTEAPVYKDALNQQLRCGISFPKARTHALVSYAEKYSLTLPEDLGFLQHPNVILAIEYLKALEQQHSSIQPVLLHRMDSGYHSTLLSEYSSATAIRRTYVSSGASEELAQTLPAHVYHLLADCYKASAPVTMDDFYPYIQYCFWSGHHPFAEIQDISEDLSNRMQTVYHPSYTYSEFVDAILNKQYTRTRIQRSLLHILLELSKEAVACQLESHSMHYARVLGFRKESSALLRHLRTHSAIPILQQVAHARTQFAHSNASASQLLHYDIQAAHLYEQVCHQKYHHTIHNEYTTGIILR